MASICYYSTNHMHLLMLSCRWQSSRRMRAHWTVLKMSNQASALISEEPGREGGSQVALVGREKVQPWTGVVFVYIYCPFGQYFEIETYLEQYAERENTPQIPCNTTVYLQISTLISCPTCNHLIKSCNHLCLKQCSCFTELQISEILCKKIFLYILAYVESFV